MTERRPRLLNTSGTAEYLYGEISDATKRRVTRLADSGVLKPVRIGQRQDRWYPVAALDRLLASGENESEAS